jgi:RNA polymerase sigma-32 factor
MPHLVARDGALSESYVAQLRRYPILAPGEERALAERWRDRRDAKALGRLVTSHLRLVVPLARTYRGYGLPLSDLVGEGNLGLLRAAELFDPDRGARFSTYARWWIRAMIQEHIVSTWSIVRLGTSGPQRVLFYRLRSMRVRLAAADWSGVDALSPEHARTIAAELRVSEADVVDMDRRLSTRDRSLNTPCRGDEDDGEELQDRLADRRPDPETGLAARQERAVRRQALAQAIGTLDERERRIVLARCLRDRPVTLQALADEHGISHERVRQIERRAIEKLRRTACAEAARRRAAREMTKI